MRILGIIPARYHSTRFPGKALVDIQGKSMVQRVYDQALKAQGLTKVVVATDDSRIFKHIQDLGGNACMTSEQHPSGTDRCHEALEQDSQNFDFVINIQGDEPFINPRQIEELVSGLTTDIEIATQAKMIDTAEQLSDINCVKVVFDASGNAIYFSRSAVPYQRNLPMNQWIESYDYYQHIGLYGYRTDILRQITRIPPSSLEKAEALEQLRWLDHGYRIKVLTTAYRGHGIDTPEDLAQALANQSF